MTDSDDALLARIHRLTVRDAEGQWSDADRAEFKELLGTSHARRLYLRFMQDSASLRWIFSGRHWGQPTLPEDENSKSGRNSSSRTAWLPLALAAALVGVAAFAWQNAQNQGRPGVGAVHMAPANSSVATVTRASGVAWGATSEAPGLLSRVTIGEALQFSEGTLELTFDSGAQVTLFGPAEVEISSPMSILCSRGRVTTLVGESGKGFTINTPKARIVDLGTQFGVNISEAGDTQVVVFQGAVDLTRHAKGATSDSGSAGVAKGRWVRLQQGDALMVDDAGEARVMAVERGDFFPASPRETSERLRRSAIVDVRDNIRPGESTKCYQIVRGGLREDAVSFVDRSHQWNGVDGAGLPQFLLGADYIMPFNDDKFIRDLRVEVEISRPATCYVFLDQNMTPPAWLRDSFEDTGLTIGLDGAKTEWHKKHELAEGAGRSVDFVFSIWRREIARPGAVTFGGVEPPKPKTKSLGFNMYGIAVVPK